MRFTNKLVTCACVFLLLLTFVNRSHAQLYPVQVTPQLVPPYSVYLSDYANPGSEKLRVIILQRDLTQPSYQLRLVMSIELNGKVIMRTANAYHPPPLNIDPGVPTIISGAELAPYVDSRNIDFIGYSRQQYEKTRALPEGGYRIIFTAYDYRRQDVQVSNEGSSFYYLSKNEPPLINFPACGTKIPVKEPQQIVFSWLPRNTSSPTSAADTEYEFTLYETRPPGRNPNDVINTTQPIFRTRIDVTTFVYGPTEPLLLQDMKYVWRVQAIDKSGRDAFRNNGYSEVCTFTYGGADATFDIGVVKNLQAVGETERRAKISWEASNYDGYKVYYKKTGSYVGTSTSYEWFWSNVTSNELTLFNLEPDTEYETRVQTKKSGIFGPYSEIIKFRTKQKQVLECGKETVLAKADETKPLLAAQQGMTILVDDMHMTLVQVRPLGAGWFEGLGTVAPKILGRANFYVQFKRLYIDENQVAGFGRIDFVNKGVVELVKQQMVNALLKDKQAQQQANRDQWSGQTFQEKIFKYDEIIIAGIQFENDELLITDSAGNSFSNAEITQLLIDVPEKAIIIEDKNGDQWVVQKDANGENKITKVPGGGLVVGPDEKIVNEKELSGLYRKILKALRKYQQAIDEYQASIEQTKPSKGGGPSLFEDELEMMWAELPACLASSKDRIGEISENVKAYRDSGTFKSVQFIIPVAKILSSEYPTISDKNNAPDERVESAVCEALAASTWCLGIFDDCDDVEKKLEAIKSAYNESKKVTGKIPYSVSNRVLNGDNMKVGDHDYDLISIQFSGAADKDYTVDPKLYMEYDERVNSILSGSIRQRGFALKDGNEVVIKILVFEDDEEKFNASKEALRKYLFGGNIQVAETIVLSKLSDIRASVKKAVEDVLTYKNEDDASCNLCTRAALLNLKNDPVLFPRQGSYVYFTFGKESDPEINGEISGEGSATEIVNDFQNYESNSLKKYFVEEVKLESEDYEQFWTRLQDKADLGSIIIGIYKPKHVFMLVPGGMVKVIDNKSHTTNWTLDEEYKDDPRVEQGDKYGFAFAFRKVQFVPRILECGANIKSDNAPLYANMDYKGVTNLEVPKNLRWFRYIK